jgi:hypothetical protein
VVTPPHLSGPERTALADFVDRTPWARLGPGDWNRLRQFIVITHGLGTRISGNDFRLMLLQGGWPDADDAAARSVVAAYEHGRALLSLYDERIGSR